MRRSCGGNSVVIHPQVSHRPPRPLPVDSVSFSFLDEKLSRAMALRLNLGPAFAVVLHEAPWHWVVLCFDER